MANGHEIPEPTELVYVPAPSWHPVLLAVGLAGIGIGLFAGWVYSVAGGVLAVAVLGSWIRASSFELGRLPRRQRLTSAVLPAVPLRSGSESPYEDS